MSNLRRLARSRCIAACLAALTIIRTAQRAGTAAEQNAIGSIEGAVVLDGQPDQYVRNALVTISSIDPVLTRTETTDSSGRFLFSNLPAARFSIEVKKVGYLVGKYGAQVYGQPGVRLSLEKGQNLRDVRVVVFKGGVISGRVQNELGTPTDAAQVILSRQVAIAGQAFPLVVQSWSAATDDLGRYRFYGLPPGDFSVAVLPLGVTNEPDVPRLATGEVERVIAAARSAGSQSRSGTHIVSAVPSAGYVTAEVPGLHLALADELPNVDVRLSRGYLTTVEGVVTTATGVPVSSVKVTLRPAQESGLSPLNQRTVSTTSSGAYRISNLLPGSYVVTAHSMPSAPAGSGWATATLTVSGGVAQVPLALRPGGVVSGRIVLDEAVQATPELELSLGIFLFSSTGEPTDRPRIVGRAEGIFEFADLAPGRYRLTYSAATASGWFLAAAKTSLGSVVDPPFLEIQPGDMVRDLVVTFTRRPTEISGTLFDRDGHSSSGYSIVIFPSDPALWLSSSFRVRETALASNGSYSVRGLPPGKYLIAARMIGDQGGTSPQILAQLIGFAVPVTLAAGEAIVQDLRIGGQKSLASSMPLPRSNYSDQKAFLSLGRQW